MINPGTVLTLDVEKPAAGGRMLARHKGQVVLVWGAVPGERVQARVERATRSVLYAVTTDVVSASPDRREAPADWRCGGNVLAHVAYERQLTLKGEIVQDALARIGRVPLTEPPIVIGSPERGYRMRARLHAREGRLGFYREGTHELCRVGSTGQLLPETVAWLAAAEETLRRNNLMELAALELAENVPGTERATRIEVRDGIDPEPYGSLVSDEQTVTDILHVRDGDPGSALTLRRDVGSFFQGNRFLLERLIRHVVALVPSGPLVDLYAGVGLFGLSLAAAGAEEVTVVEGDQSSGTDLVANAEPFLDRVQVHLASVEQFLSTVTPGPPSGTRPTYVVDPPRTGMSKDALAGIVDAAPGRIVYVSCDVATLARDTRTLLDGGYELAGVSGIDLFPNTAHVETVVVFDRA
jgi:23S rRNA (uracil1939-C5)-methyltransferase